MSTNRSVGRLTATQDKVRLTATQENVRFTASQGNDRSAVTHKPKKDRSGLCAFAFADGGWVAFCALV